MIFFEAIILLFRNSNFTIKEKVIEMKSIKKFGIVIMSILSTSVFAGEEWCSGYHSPNNTYSYCTTNPKGEGNCTWWAAHQRPDLNFSHINGRRRDAKNWKWYAEQNEMAVGNSPVVGSIAVFQNGQYGHVAHVESVNSNGTFDVTEMGYDWFDGMRSSTYSLSSLGGVLGFILPPNECTENFDGSIACQHGLHTHIIHDDYRCSNGQCWEPGGETNCWDASNWFEIEGTDVSNTVAMRERSMCAEVYNSGDSTDGVGGGNNPNLTIDLDIFADNHRVDDKTVGYDKPLRLKAKISSHNADTEDGIESGKDRIETDFFISDNNKVTWVPIGERQYTRIENLEEGDHHTESITVGPFTYHAGTILHFKSCTDTEHEVAEQNENDNCDIEKVTLSNPPTYDITLYDLEREPHVVGQPWTVNFKVANLGNAPIPQNFGIVHNVHGVTTGSQRVDNLQPGEVRTLSVGGIQVYAGTQTVQICYQGGDAFTETSTTNNCTDTITISGPDYGDIVPLVEYWNDYLQCHTWVTEGEIVSLDSNTQWNNEGVAGYVYNTPQPGTVPIYRAWRHGRHVPAINATREGCHLLTRNSNYEGIGSN